MPEQIIKERLSLLEPTYRQFVSSDEPQLITAALAEVHALDAVGTLALENSFMMFLLFFLNRNDFAIYIYEECHLNPEKAQQLANAFFLALPLGIRNSYEAALSKKTPIDTEDSSSLINEIAEAEAAISTIPAVRTMGSDSHLPTPPSSETTYSSTQSAILQEGLHVPQTTPTPQQTSRWESETT
jgi:hypothetical protein